MKLRTRDIIAALLSILLVRIAWTDYGAGSENLGVDITLAFYADLQSTVRLFHGSDDGGGAGGGGGGESLKTAKPVPLDVDGDGIVEAVVLPTVLSGGGGGSVGGGGGGNDGRGGTKDGGVRWGLKVLDLKPVHSGPSGIADLSAYPFLPRTMFVSNTTKELSSDLPPGSSTVVPVKMTSGQLILNDPHSSHFGTKKKKKREVETDKSDPSYDRTRHYYCGKDWHDAAQNCRKHCPGGSASECGDGENCYADTPCDAVAVPTPSPNMEFNETTLSLTPGGGLPCVVTVWTDGSVTLHGLTGDVPPSDVVESDKKKKKKKRKKGGSGEDVKLELRRMWKVNPFPPAPSSSGSDTETEDGDKKEGGEANKDATTAATYLHFHEIDVTLLDSDVPIGDRGVVIIAARYHRKREDDHPDHLYRYHEELFSSYHAIDAVTGSILWTHDGYLEAKKREEAMNVPGPVHVDYVMSTGRRRSMIPDLTHNVNVDVAVDGSLEYCLSVFRNSALREESGVFPHLHWGDGREDSKLGVAHFDRRHRGGGGGGGQSSKRRKAGAKAKRGGGGAGGDVAGSGKTKSKSVLDKVSPVLSAGRKAQQQSSTEVDPTTGKEHKKKQHHKHKNKHHKRGSASKGPIYGRPNVLISHGYDGIKAFSLRNGRPVCHVSLQDLGLYADMNNDGIIDHVQVITDQSNSGSKTKDTYMWIRDLVRRVKEEENGPKAAEMNKKEEGLSLFGPRSVDPRLCHVLALSGLPAREEIFSASLCDGGPTKRKKTSQQRDNQATMASSEKLSSAPPLLVECLDGHPHKKDIIFAMNNGVVSRYDTYGKREWKTSHLLSDELPTWSSHPMAAQSIPFLGRINFPKSMSTPEVRPILLSGEDGMTILSSGRGRILASTSFPQASVSRPILGDFSGDGITDVMVLSRDAVWGYQIIVITSGGSNFLRLLVGLVFMGICAAAVRNSVTNGGKSGVDKRSTDE